MWDGINLVSLTPVSLLLLTVLMLLTGRLVPRRVYLDKAKESESWHQAYLVCEASRATLEAQTREMLEVGKTNAAFLAAIHELSESRKRQLEEG